MSICIQPVANICKEISDTNLQRILIRWKINLNEAFISGASSSRLHQEEVP